MIDFSKYQYNKNRHMWEDHEYEPIYLKVVNKDLQGRSRFQYEIGQVYSINDPVCPLDDWKYCHFARTFTACILNSSEHDTSRFLVVEPLTYIFVHGEKWSETYYCSDEVRIIGEVDPVDVVKGLITESKNQNKMIRLAFQEYVKCIVEAVSWRR